VDVTSIASGMTGMTAGKLQLDVGTAVLGKAMDVTADAVLQLVSSMTQSTPHAVPAGLTFSASGLSSGSSSRVIATL
jgi:Putative motility protein